MVVATEHVLWDRKKPRSNLIQLVGRSTFHPEVRRSNPRIVMAAPICAVVLFVRSFASVYSKCREIPLDE